MKFSIARDRIYEALQKVVNVIPQRSPLLMLQNVLIKTEDQSVFLTGSDTEITIVSEVEAEVEQAGSIAVPGRLLNDVIRELPNVPMTFESNDAFRMTMTTEFGEYRLAGEDPVGFPRSPELAEGEQVILDNEVLKRLIEDTAFATSTDELRPSLNGVYFEAQPGSIQAVATDGHRMALVRYADEAIQCESLKAIISNRAVNFLMRSLEGEGQLKAVFGERHAAFHLNHTTLYARLITEQFVDYRRVIPEEIKFEMVADTAQVYAATKRVALFSNPITSQVVLRISPDAVQLHAEDVDFGGSATEKIPCQFSGDEFLVAFNSKYLLDMLKHIHTPQLVMQFVRPDYAALARPVGLPENEEQLTLLMPIRLETP